MEFRFREAADKFLTENRDLDDFAPFPSARERGAYRQLPEELRAQILTAGEACLDYRFPPIYATDFMAFKRTGNRVNYERLYFERRYHLNSLVMAECVEGGGRFLDQIINGIFALCEESAWQLPAHNTYKRNHPQEILPDASCPVLDLFACETGAQLACICHLLRDELDAVSPFIAVRILSELQRRIIEPYLKQHFWWMGQGDEPMCNWTPWCTQNVLIAVFLSGCSQDTRRAVLRKAAESCDFFLKDYGEDGCCDEGALYFRRAGLCLDAAADLMNRVTGGAFSHLYQWSKMKNIAAYIKNVHVEGGRYFNFADCSPLPGRCGAREYLFGRRTGQEDLMRFAAKDFQAAQAEICQDETYRLSLYYRLLHAFSYSEIMAYDTLLPVPARDIYYPSIGLFIARSRAFCLAVKAGDNGDNHNHNDSGSLTLYKNGSPILVDIGVESYTAKTFSDRRYEIWTMQSGYHNLPTIEGKDQCDGRNYGASDVRHELGAERAEISMELIHAYPLAGEGHFYKRQVRLDKKEECITLRDSTDCGNVTLNFIIYERPEWERQNSDTFVAKLGDVILEFAGAKLLAVETLPITDPRLQAAWDHDLYRIRLNMEGGEFSLAIR